VIDAHVHLGSAFAKPFGEPWLAAGQLVDRMNRWGVDQAVLLPLESPEASPRGFFSNHDCLTAYHAFPERFLPFCCVDPRRPEADTLLCEWREAGCVGFGEHKTALAIDDFRSKRLYSACGELGWPVLIHLDHLAPFQLNWDEPGLPRLRRLVYELSDVIFIMHGPGWWSELSADAPPGVIYPTGPIEAEGVAGLLLSETPNVYADLSAYSAYNALTRDPDFTPVFLERNWHKLLFGTDYLKPGQECPIVRWVKEVDIPEACREAIQEGNLKQLLGLT
jgi:predicted TIM-barrel fold metal-dependent hydrolase